MNKKLTTVIEITDTHIKLFQARTSGTGSILTYFDNKKITTFSDEAVTKLLSTMVARQRISSGHVLCVIPRRFAILKHASFPSHQEEEIRKMVSLQVVNNVPYSRE